MGLGNGENKNPSTSYIVISDTNPGGNKNGSNIPDYDEFRSFLNWIKYQPEDCERIWVKKGESGYEKKIASLSRIILPGDILDLRDPENADRSNVTVNLTLSKKNRWDNFVKAYQKEYGVRYFLQLSS